MVILPADPFPVVSGLMAYLIGRDNKLAQSPALMKETLTSSSILKTKLPGSPPNLLLLNNGVAAEAASKVAVNTTTQSNSSRRAKTSSSAWVPTFATHTESAR